MRQEALKDGGRGSLMGPSQPYEAVWGLHMALWTTSKWWNVFILFFKLSIEIEHICKKICIM